MMEIINQRDKEILHQLDFHAREPVTSLAKKLRMGKEGLSYRIKRLEKLGVISGYQTSSAGRSSFLPAS